ncbi:MAG: DUF4272 domain-containing protein [Planctomycetaceae bacterium]|nr:DUF4272 domain-containing protein [Planctomycetaceae bacterium]
MAAKRFWCLAAVIMRGNHEALAESLKTQAQLSKAEKKTAFQAHATTANEITQWLKAQGLWASLSAKERQMMARDFGSWRKKEKIDSSWRREAAAVLGWALGYTQQIAPWDEASAHKELIEAAGGFLNPVADRIARATLLPRQQLEGARDVAEAWLWRARTTQLQRIRRKAPPGITFEEIIRLSSEKAAQMGLFQPIDGDFPAMGKPYRALTSEEWSEMHSIATERLYAMNWLCGRSRRWDHVRCDT